MPARGADGTIKDRPEDFVVEEIPLYEPSGEGEHAYLTIRRRSLSTLDVVRLLASHYGVHKRDIGYAGLKDKHAITTQVFSVRLVSRRVEDEPPLMHNRLEVIGAERHTNKLRRGHLRGNRFTIRVRHVPENAADEARCVLDRLARTGAPNRFGEQRFGHLGRNHLLGRALVLGDCSQFLDLLLGPCAGRPDAQPEGRDLYAQGRYAEAFAMFPPALRAERAALRALAQGRAPERAVLAISAVERGFYASAMQSSVFNAILDERIEESALGVLREGDVAIEHEGRRLMDVDNEFLHDPTTPGRVAHIEISPTGAMWGRSSQGRACRRAGGRVHDAEVRALGQAGLSPSDMEASSSRLTGPLEGSRRPLRVPVREHEVRAGADEHGPFVECRFALERGAYATVVMEEILKPSRNAGL